jgi:hypothetical protein
LEVDFNMETMQPEDVSLLEQRLADRIEPWKPSLWQKLVAGVTGVALYAMTAFVPGCDGSNGNGNAINPIPSDYNVAANITPASGSGVGPDDDPLAVSLRTPQLSPECQADAVCSAAATTDGADVEVTATYDNATPSDTSDDETVNVATQNNAAWDTVVAGSVTMADAHGGAGLADGERITIDAVVTATDTEGNAQTARGSATVTYEAATNPVRVTGCNVVSSNVGVVLDIQCYADAPTPIDLLGNWRLTGGPASATILEDGLIRSSGVMTDGDVTNWIYTVTASDGTNTSAPYVFTVPVDTLESHLALHCTDGTNPDLLLPEVTVDAVAPCNSGFNEVLKPANTGDPDYTLDIDPACAQTAISSRPADELEAHTHYNNGTTPSSVFSGCTVDFAQVTYHHD